MSKIINKEGAGIGLIFFEMWYYWRNYAEYYASYLIAIIEFRFSAIKFLANSYRFIENLLDVTTGRSESPEIY